MHSRDLIIYVHHEAVKLKVKPIDVYVKASISGKSVSNWIKKNPKVKKCLRYRIEMALCEIAGQNNISRKMNEAVYIEN